MDGPKPPISNLIRQHICRLVSSLRFIIIPEIILVGGPDQSDVSVRRVQLAKGAIRVKTRYVWHARAFLIKHGKGSLTGRVLTRQIVTIFLVVAILTPVTYTVSSFSFISTNNSRIWWIKTRAECSSKRQCRLLWREIMKMAKILSIE